MKKKIKIFFILWAIFSVGLFWGEWLLDIVFHSKRDILKIEIMESVIIGFLVASFWIIGNKSLHK